MPRKESRKKKSKPKKASKKKCKKSVVEDKRKCEVVLSMEDVHKIYDLGEVQVHALSGVDLKICKGDHVSIMGPSGSGKSTLLHIIGCLDIPTKGKVMLDSINVSDLTEDELARVRAKQIGFVFQFFYLVPSLSAIENVMLPMMFDGIDFEERYEIARRLLEKVGMGKRMDHRPSQLSGGERQRVAIARALSQDPSILLADEPTGNLDSKVGKEIIELFTDLNKKEGITLITVTHDPGIARFADKIIHIQDGKVCKIEVVK